MKESNPRTVYEWLHYRTSILPDYCDRKYLRADGTLNVEAFVGQEKRFESALQQLRGVNLDISHEANQIRDSMEASKHHSKLNFLELFDGKYTPAMMLAVGSTILVQFGGAYAIGSYASSIFEGGGCSAKVGSTALSINQLIFAIAGVVLTDKWGRRPLWLISAAGTCFGNILIALAFLLKEFHESKEISAALVLLGMLIFSATFTTGMSGSQWIILSEILPVNVKALAGSLITLLNWFLSWITTFTFNFAFRWSATGTFSIFASVCATTFVFVAKILPETKGRTLEEIEASLSH
ncbi:hypothetical protein M9H77_27797 [Catharanthus roseus]|uniref:Uncharacterized protein n=1 Tax=Catharanthus roseus TaxID=4058 RepID=A0ACC0ADW9_CATRO|nr:hypothetical protein M9H77_27797 [Catharanthus roseus]